MAKRKEPTILGAPPLQPASSVKRLDSRSVTPSPEIEVVKHEDVVTVQSHIRRRPQQKDEPEVRVRTISKEGKEAWENAKKGNY